MRTALDFFVLGFLQSLVHFAVWDYLATVGGLHVGGRVSLPHRLTFGQATMQWNSKSESASSSPRTEVGIWHANGATVLPFHVLGVFIGRSLGIVVYFFIRRYQRMPNRAEMLVRSLTLVHSGEYRLNGFRSNMSVTRSWNVWRTRTGASQV
jgi:hypothetical protein